MSNERGFVTKGSSEYFDERRARMQTHIDRAKDKINEIEAKVRGEIESIISERNLMRRHMDEFLRHRENLVGERGRIEALIDQLASTIEVLDTELPQLDRLMAELEGDFCRADALLDNAEKGKRRQLNKHERTKTKYELRKTRLDLRQRIFCKESDEKESA